MRVSDPSLLGHDFAGNGKENITVRNLLLHNAGFPPDPTPNYCMEMHVHIYIMLQQTHSMHLLYYVYVCAGYPEFGCPQTASYHPAEDFSCQEMIYHALLSQVHIYTLHRVYELCTGLQCKSTELCAHI